MSVNPSQTVPSPSSHKGPQMEAQAGPGIRTITIGGGVTIGSRRVSPHDIARVDGTYMNEGKRKKENEKKDF